MGEIWSKFISNCKKSIDIGIIRYSLYSFSVLILPLILIIAPWIVMIVSLVLDNSTMLLSSMVGVLFSLAMLIVIIFLGFYTENCSWKAYAHTIETGEKLSYKEYFKGGCSGYWSYVGKSTLHVVLPIIVLLLLIGFVYIIPFIGFIVGDFLYILAITYIFYRFYSKLFGVGYDDFKMQLNNYLMIIILSTIMSFFGLLLLDMIIILFLVPITLMIVLSKKNGEIINKEDIEY